MKKRLKTLIFIVSLIFVLVAGSCKAAEDRENENHSQPENSYPETPSAGSDNEQLLPWQAIGGD